MKKICLLLTVVMLLTTFCSCGDGGNNSALEGNTYVEGFPIVKEKETLEIFTVKTINHGDFDEMGFTKYYEESHQYGEDDQRARVLIALDGDEVVGTLMVERETEAPEVGSVGCTTVKPSHQGRHIAVNMVTIGTKFLRDAGMKDAYLGYTYSGLDHMYGYAGYKICNYYMMAKKEL